MFQILVQNIKQTVYFRGAIAAVDQGFISLINFGVQILLIKTVSKNEFGYYSLAMAIVMYFVSCQNAVVNTPITVSIAGKTNLEKSNYVSSLFSGQLFFLSTASILGLILILLIHNIGFNYEVLVIAASLCIGSFGILNREFLRSYYFAEELPVKVLKLDIYYGLLYASLIVISLLLYKISVPLIIVFMGLAAGFDSLILNKSFKFQFNLQDIKKAYLENWQISKWSLIGITATHLQSFSYLYVIGGLLGSAAMAEVSASRLLLMPLALIIIGWGRVIRPYGAKLREKGELKKFFKKLIFASVAYPILVLSLTGIIQIFSDTILKYLLNEQYKTVFDYLIFWGILGSVGFIKANANYGLQVMKKFKSLALFNTITMVITILFSFVLTSKYQIKGALLASLIGEIIFSSFLWFHLYNSIFIEKVRNV